MSKRSMKGKNVKTFNFGCSGGIGGSEMKVRLVALKNGEVISVIQPHTREERKAHAQKVKEFTTVHAPRVVRPKLFGEEKIDEMKEMDAILSEISDLSSDSGSSSDSSSASAPDVIYGDKQEKADKKLYRALAKYEKAPHSESTVPEVIFDDKLEKDDEKLYHALAKYEKAPHFESTVPEVIFDDKLEKADEKLQEEIYEYEHGLEYNSALEHEYDEKEMDGIFGEIMREIDENCAREHLMQIDHVLLTEIRSELLNRW